MNRVLYTSFLPRFCVTSCSPRVLPAVHQHAYPSTRPGVHACARHRQVLSNRRVLSIINVYRMRNRVQARPRYHPYPPALHPPPLLLAGFVHHPPPRPFLRRALISRGAKALSWKFTPVPTSFPSRKRGCRSACRWLLPPPPPLFFPARCFFRARKTERRLAQRRERQGGNARLNERTNEGADGVFLIFLLAHAVLSFVTKRREGRYDERKVEEVVKGRGVEKWYFRRS